MNKKYCYILVEKTTKKVIPKYFTPSGNEKNAIFTSKKNAERTIDNLQSYNLSGIEIEIQSLNAFSTEDLEELRGRK